MKNVFKEFDVKGFGKFAVKLNEKTLDYLEGIYPKDSSAGKRNIALSPAFVRTIPKLKELEPVRTIFFNKTLETNWFVPWHQDLTVALKEKKINPDFINWTIKDGIPHAEAPVNLLEKMVTIRISLDSTNEKNGGLWVIPGTQKLGKLSQKKIRKIVNNNDGVCLTGKRGTIYLFSPLLLHRSFKSKTNLPRRALQIEMAPKDALPKPLEWAFIS